LSLTFLSRPKSEGGGGGNLGEKGATIVGLDVLRLWGF